MKQTITLFLLAFGLLGTAALGLEMSAPEAQEEGRWWKDRSVIEALDLRPDQREQIEELFLEYRLRLVDRRASLEREELRLQPLVDADELDMPRVEAQVKKVVAARGELELARTMMMLSIRQSLSGEQWHRLQEIERARRPRAPLPPLPPSATLPAAPRVAPVAEAPPAPLPPADPEPVPSPEGGGFD